MKIKYFNRDPVEIFTFKDLCGVLNQAHLHMWIEGYGSVLSFEEVTKLKGLAKSLAKMTKEMPVQKKALADQVNQSLDDLLKRYDKDLMERLFTVISQYSKRTYYKSYFISFLKKVSSYSKEHVETCVRNYLSREYFKSGKYLPYLHKIVENTPQLTLVRDIYSIASKEFDPITTEYSKTKVLDFSTNKYYGFSIALLNNPSNYESLFLYEFVDEESLEKMDWRDFSVVEFMIASLLYRASKEILRDKLEKYWKIWIKYKERFRETLQGLN